MTDLTAISDAINDIGIANRVRAALILKAAEHPDNPRAAELADEVFAGDGSTAHRYRLAVVAHPAVTAELPTPSDAAIIQAVQDIWAEKGVAP